MFTWKSGGEFCFDIILSALPRVKRFQADRVKEGVDGAPNRRNTHMVQLRAVAPTSDTSIILEPICWVQPGDFSQRVTIHTLGTGGASKTDEFSEKFQTAFDQPLPSFSENYNTFFLISCSKIPL